MLEPLPYADVDRIVTLWETNRGGTTRNVIAPANFVAWTERTRTLEHLGMVEGANLVGLLDGQPVRISGLAASSGVFRAVGVHPALGRAYTADEDASNAVVVLTHEFWQRRLGGRQDVLGLTLSTDAGPRTVVGVMPPGFTILGARADFLIPYGMTTAELREYRGRRNSYAMARLRDGVSFEQAGAEMRGIFAQLEKEVPNLNATRTVMLFRPQDQMVGEVRPALIALMTAVALVLIVACVNVANLLLARSAAREREVATRAALGAQPLRARPLVGCRRARCDARGVAAHRRLSS
jgi:putative ABC transport system permease protein